MWTLCIGAIDKSVQSHEHDHFITLRPAYVSRAICAAGYDATPTRSGLGHCTERFPIPDPAPTEITTSMPNACFYTIPLLFSDSCTHYS